MTQTHTPLPYKMIKFPNYDGGTYIAIHQGDETCIAKWYSATPQDEENAAFIVRACNSHYDLLEVLKAALVLMEGQFGESPAIRAAIAKAEGKHEISS